MDEAGLQLVPDAAPRDPTQQRFKLAAVAYAQRERVRAGREHVELLRQLRVESDYPGPALRRIENVGVAEAAHEGEALESLEANPSGQQVGHRDVPSLEPGEEER